MRRSTPTREDIRDLVTRVRAQVEFMTEPSKKTLNRQRLHRKRRRGHHHK